MLLPSQVITLCAEYLNLKLSYSLFGNDTVALLFVCLYVQLFPNDLFLNAIEAFLGPDLAPFQRILASISILSYLQLHPLSTILAFISLVSIFFELSLIVAILFEHFKLCLLLNLVLIGSLLSAVLQLNVHSLNAASLTFQLLFAVSFLFFTGAIKLKLYAADRILAKTDVELEMNCRKMKGMVM